MVRRIVSCCSCQRRFLATNARTACNQCVTDSSEGATKTATKTNEVTESSESDSSNSNYSIIVEQTSAAAINNAEENQKPISASSNTHNTSDDDLCFICGSSLKHISTLQGRTNHIKRCSKKYGVSGRDVRINDDDELFTNEQTAPGSSNGAAAVSTTSNNTMNPYVRNISWHEGADVDLALARNEPDISTAPTSNEDTVAQAQEASSKQSHMRNFFPTTKPRSLTNVLLAGARRVAKSAEIASKRAFKDNSNARPASSKGGRHQKRRRTDYTKVACPSYKKIPGTDFVCDGFLYARSSLTKNYFLTHFHSDHYGGISSSWNAGIIYCSLATANLVHQQLGVDRKYLHPLGMLTPTVIESNGRPITVTLMDANHCPGAVMFLFQVGKRNILHVGDFRWSRNVMLQNAPLRAFSTQQARLDDLFLDTTYASDEKYSFPSQSEAIRATVELAQKEYETSRQKGQKTLFLFGAYTIGKERIYLSVAEKLGKKVFVDKSRFRILSALGWPREKMTLFTTAKEETCIWVVPLGHINFKNMQPYIDSANSKVFSKRYDRIVGFRPTGWSITAKGSSIISSRSSGILTVHGVPYSEHSSFPELVDCIQCLKPKKITPTVSVSTSSEQVDRLLTGITQKKLWER